MEKVIADLEKINFELDENLKNLGEYSDSDLEAVIDLIVLENMADINSLIIGDPSKFNKNIKLILEDIITNKFSNNPKLKDKLNILKLLSIKENK